MATARSGSSRTRSTLRSGSGSTRLTPVRSSVPIPTEGANVESLRLDRPLHPGYPIDEIGGVGGPSQVRVLGQGRRTRLVRVDPDDGEPAVRLARGGPE